MTTRRELLTGAAVLAFSATSEAAEPKPAPSEVNATEDLMREHGVLRRVLLVYGEAIQRLESGGQISAEPIAAGAGIVRRFIEGYHEKLEEQFVFPRFTSGPNAELVRVLKEQHDAGRRVTGEILKLATSSGLGSRNQRHQLALALQSFSRMYEPHAAREDTVLFPAFHALFSEKEFDELGERFEEQEHKLLGASGFEGALREVEQLEKALGINDLAKFTPA